MFKERKELITKWWSNWNTQKVRDQLIVRSVNPSESPDGGTPTHSSAVQSVDPGKREVKLCPP